MKQPASEKIENTHPLRKAQRVRHPKKLILMRPYAEAHRVEVRKRRGGGDVGVGDAVVPGEAVVVPERPEEAEEERGGGERVAEAAPEKLACVGEAAVEAHDGETAKLHAGSRAGERDEERHVERVEEKNDRGADDGVHFLEGEFAAERTEQSGEAGAGEAQEKRVESAGETAVGERGDGDERVLRARAVVGSGGEVEPRLDADFDALGAIRGCPTRRGVSADRNGSRCDCAVVLRVAMHARFVFYVGDPSFVKASSSEGKAGLGVVGAKAAAARAVLLEAERDFAVPVGLGSIGGDAHRTYARVGVIIFRLRNIAKGAGFRIVEQKGATLRADAYHWSILRCGGSSGT